MGFSPSKTLVVFVHIQEQTESFGLLLSSQHFLYNIRPFSFNTNLNSLFNYPVFLLRKQLAFNCLGNFSAEQFYVIFALLQLFPQQ